MQPLTSVREVTIPAEDALLEGVLGVPAGAEGVVVFAHGSGSSRHSARNRRVADALRATGLGTLLFDLLTAEEERADHLTGELQFDVELLASRLEAATAWVRAELIDEGRIACIGYFGASTGAAAALTTAANIGTGIKAVVSRGGRPDLAGAALAEIAAPTLLIVGAEDGPVVELNREAYEQLPSEKRLEIIPGAGHLFEEPGALDRVSELASAWFTRHLHGSALEP